MPEEKNDVSNALHVDVMNRMKNPSIGSVLYQTETLCTTLRAFTDSRFPPEARKISNIFGVLANRVRDQILNIEVAGSPVLDSGTVQKLLDLGKVTRDIYYCIRFLQASDPINVPPGIQAAISNLVNKYIPDILRCKPLDVVVVVRPQWTYNISFIDLLGSLEKLIQVSDLDPLGELDAHDLRSLLLKLWQDDGLEDDPPKYVAVLSFAGLDRDNVLLYPLLAHEIGHFIDFSYPETIYENPKMKPEDYLPSAREVRALLDKFYRPMPDASSEEIRTARSQSIAEHLGERIKFCLREITADLLATRMLGIPFFVALAEYLKTLFAWSEPIVGRSPGYPGMAYRLNIVWDELIEVIGAKGALDEGKKLVDVLGAYTPKPADGKRLKYLDLWHNRFKNQKWDISAPKEAPDFLTALDRMAEQKVHGVLPRLRRLVRKVIPADKAAKVAQSLSDMMRLLDARVPPFQQLLEKKEVWKSGPPEISFGNVLNAGWLYQIGFGEAKERAKQPSGRYKEYQNTCDLLFKAIELSGARDAIEEVDKKNRLLTRIRG